ncbi:membrane protein [Fulvitalea axinellae]|uniref:Membrane protein n=1 Tax=Fulvitalea axinellae TaxID=1182444 RepID=A0AAU9CC54_9BACT|nr:membrane protein [Fulvitalea axinellae]
MPRKNQADFREWSRRIHLYLGLITGAVTLLTCLTGAILVFEDELGPYVYPERYDFVPTSEKVELETYRHIIEKDNSILSNGKVTGARVFGPDYLAYQFFVSNKEKQRRTVYANPYKVEILDVSESKKEFFHTVEMLHRNLLLEKVGKQITAYCTVAFIVLLISGIILWVPKSKKGWKTRFKVKLKGASWKRLNYDLHVVLGFYVAVFGLILSLTGLVWSFDFIRGGIISLGTNRGKEKPKSEIIKDKSQSTITLDEAHKLITEDFEEIWRTTIRVSSKKDGTAWGAVTHADSPHENGYDAVHLDKYSGKKLKTEKFEDLPAGDKLYRYMYPIHIGTIFGMPTKILAFITCLIGFGLPITGLIMWIIKGKRLPGISSRRKKKVSRGLKAKTL